MATLQTKTGGVYGVALSGDGGTVASGSVDGTVRLWEVVGGRPLATLQSYSNGIWGVAVGGDGRTLASGSFDGTDGCSPPASRTLRLRDVGAVI